MRRGAGGGDAGGLDGDEVVYGEGLGGDWVGAVSGDVRFDQGAGEDVAWGKVRWLSLVRR